MKKLNQHNKLSNTKLLERGGLMIEALAMLGLIAVVTPTMYKKSAERTLEVEDINTATTVRTYMNAVEAYMANEYGTFVSEPQAGDPAVTEHTGKKGHFYEDPNNPAAFGSRDGTAYAYYVDNAELANYLPYGFDVNRAMFEYNAPKTRIVKNGNNLTAFVSFPAKNGQADGIGQERTARIASLVGSTGGYKPNSNTARGIGGIWTLTQGEGEGGSTQLGDLGFDGDNVYSLVTASANVAMDVNGGQMDNDKYLQRTREDDTNPGSGDEMWRNTMRTDLYLGGHLGNETQTLQAGDDGSKRYSIRNIQSLIVGADTANMVGDVDADGNPVTDADGNQTQSESKKYGLYITGGANEDYANAYIGGTLSALKRGFYVTTGEQIDNAADDTYSGTQFLIGENDSTDYTTEIRGDGDITNAGANGILLGNFANESGSVVTIGDTPKEDGTIGVGLTLENDGSNQYEYFLGENIQIYDDRNKPANDGVTLDQVLFFDDGSSPQGYNLIPANVEGGLAAPTAFTNAYVGGRKYQVRIGANTLVDALLSARQVDTQKLRTANLSAGSADIDDAEKWLNVDQYGVMIETPSTQPGKTILALADNEDGSTDGIYLRITDSSARTEDDIRTSFYVDSDGYSYSQTNNATGQRSSFSMMTDDSYSSASLQSGEIELTARNYTNTDGDTEKGMIYLTADKGKVSSGSETPSEIRLRNSELDIRMQGNDFFITQASSSRRAKHISDGEDGFGIRENDDFRTIFKGGHVDAVGANLKVTDKNANSVLSVRGNDKVENVGDAGSAYRDSDVWGSTSKYLIAAHGNTLFTGNKAEKYTDSEGTEQTVNRSRVRYLSLGNFNDSAAVNIVTSKPEITGNSQVMTIDVDSAPESGIKIEDGKYVYSGAGHFAGANGGYGLLEGGIYVRKGMIEMLPGVGSAGNARQGAGIIQASRFVANNMDPTTYERIEVPQLVDSTFVTTNYEGSSYNRYDTYMVNPAYTSVMHDIKLTTRGGARLSDILPDFINKGIYIASNTVKESANDRKMEFKLIKQGSKAVVDGFGDDTAAGAYDYVSPFMGIVPAPQCPPGYGRVITLNPVSFEMANAGTPRLQKLADDKYTYYTTPEDTMPDAMKDGSTSKLLTNVDASGNPAEGHVMHEHHELMPHQLDIRTPVLAEGTANADGSAADGKNDRAWKNAIDLNAGDKALKLEDDSSAKNFTLTNFQNIAINLRVTTPNPDSSSTGGDHIDKPYVLGYTATDDINNVFRPLTFQQSTFLKSAAVPLVYDKTKKFGDTAASGEYTSGWAVLMGFIYPYDNYKTVIDHLGVDQFSSFATGFYWNIFPVLRDRLEAYATVYCYFDRNNLYGQNVETGSGIKHVDPYDYLGALPEDFRKQPHGDYIQRLNDPDMKYYEEW